MHTTTTDTLPREIRDLGYSLPEPLVGGPRFSIQGIEVDFSTITPKLAVALALRGILTHTPPKTRKSEAQTDATA